MIFQMPKRKLTLPTSSRTKILRGGSYWDDFGTSFFGTLGDPIGTVISLAKGDRPSWSRRGSKIVPFDQRKGFLGGFLNSMGTNYLTDMIKGAADAVSRNSAVNAKVLSRDPRLLAYKLTHRYKHRPTPLHFVKNKMTFTYLPTDVRRSGLGETLYSLVTSPGFKAFGKKAAITAASYAIPRAIDYFLNRSKKKKIPAAKVMDAASEI